MSRYARARDREIVAALRRARQPKLTIGNDALNVCEHGGKNGRHRSIDCTCAGCGYLVCGCKSAPKPEPAKPGPMQVEAKLREGWRKEGHDWLFGDGNEFWVLGFSRGHFETCSIGPLFDDDFTEYPSLDAAMDAVEDAVLGASGWKRAGDYSNGQWDHSSGASVWFFKSRWCYVMADGYAKSRVEAMQLALWGKP